MKTVLVRASSVSLLRTVAPCALRGFTLVELMITLTIAGILLMIGVPAMDRLIRSNRLTTEANQFISALHGARAEAARLRGPVTLRPLGAGGALGGAAPDAGWDSAGGYAIVAEPRPFQDLNRDGDFLDPGEMSPVNPAILRSFPALSRATLIRQLDADNLMVTFAPNGMLQTRAMQLRLCDEGSPECRQITVSPAGRVTVVRIAYSGG